MANEVHDLRTHPVHLGLGAVAEALPAFTGMDWYAAYSARTAADGRTGSLPADEGSANVVTIGDNKPARRHNCATSGA
ncbi:hypothetical protein [Novosphingobium lindaniclasticum]|uniref:hypothetical protein n=1 Tax=Novosphingobium lindaniclasticum TaxID=1329895 RepID=UPI0026D34A2B